MFDESQIPPKDLQMDIREKDSFVPPELILQNQNYQNNQLIRQMLAQQGIMLAILIKICQSANLSLDDILKDMEAQIKKEQEKK